MSMKSAFEANPNLVCHPFPYKCFKMKSSIFFAISGYLIHQIEAHETENSSIYTVSNKNTTIMQASPFE